MICQDYLLWILNFSYTKQELIMETEMLLLNLTECWITTERNFIDTNFMSETC